MTCLDCGGSGVAHAVVIRAAEHADRQVRLGSSAHPGRCRCGAGVHAPTLMEMSALLDYMRSPAALTRYSGLVDVVELDPAWGPRYAGALGEVWKPGGPVGEQHRAHAWAAVEFARRPQGPKADLRQYLEIEAAK